MSNGFASANLTAGQLNAGVKMVGGHEAYLELLRGELVVVKVLKVIAGLSLVERIGAGKCDIHPSITEENFPHDPTSVGEWEWRLFCFERFFSSEKAVAEMIANDWKPAKIEHLLAFGKKYPEEQRRYPIIGLGSSCAVDGSQVVPELWHSGTVQGIGLGSWAGLWQGWPRVLAVRKV